MIASAKVKYLKVSPRKLRLVLPLVRNRTVAEALSVLNNVNKKAAGYVYKAVHSAAANAKRLPNVDENSLIISKIYADGGPMLKRFRSAPMGMAAPIRKRTSHLTVELDVVVAQRVQNIQKAKKVQKVKKQKQAQQIIQKTVSAKAKKTFKIGHAKQ